MSTRLPRLLAVAASLAAALLAPAVHAAPEPKVLNIYNWSDYIADDTLKNFEKETGIKVNYDNYDTNEILHGKLVAGKTGYDIVVPSAHFAKMQIEAGLFQKLDRSKLTNWGNLDPALLGMMAKVDPGNQYLVDWLWGYITVGVNTGKVKAALGSLPMPENPWSLIFDPKYADKLKGCGISFLDSPSEVLPIALGYVGKPAYSHTAADYAVAGEMLKKVRPDISRFSSSGYINDMVAGSVCAVLGYSGDINIARARAIAAKNGNDIVAFVPRTGSTLFFDSMAIPADAPHALRGAACGAHQQGVLRQPEQGFAEVRAKGRRRQPERVPQARGPGPDDRARLPAAGHQARADAHVHLVQDGAIEGAPRSLPPRGRPRKARQSRIRRSLDLLSR
jgi:putrescine transport system substrate-binding protein